MNEWSNGIILYDLGPTGIPRTLLQLLERIFAFYSGLGIRMALQEFCIEPLDKGMVFNFQVGIDRITMLQRHQDMSEFERDNDTATNRVNLLGAGKKDRIGLALENAVSRPTFSQ